MSAVRPNSWQTLDTLAARRILAWWIVVSKLNLVSENIIIFVPNWWEPPRIWTKNGAARRTKLPNSGSWKVLHKFKRWKMRQSHEWLEEVVRCVDHSFSSKMPTAVVTNRERQGLGASNLNQCWLRSMIQHLPSQHPRCHPPWSPIPNLTSRYFRGFRVPNIATIEPSSISGSCSHAHGHQCLFRISRWRYLR